MPYSNLRSHTQVLVAVIRREKPATRPSQINLKYVRLKWNLLEICWSLEPEKRPMAGDVVQALEAILELYDEEVNIQPISRHMWLTDVYRPSSRHLAQHPPQVQRSSKIYR
jgi:hypothetical protein